MEDRLDHVTILGKLDLHVVTVILAIRISSPFTAQLFVPPSVYPHDPPKSHPDDFIIPKTYQEHDSLPYHQDMSRTGKLAPEVNRYVD